MTVTVTDEQRAATLKRTRTEFEGRRLFIGLSAKDREYLVTCSERGIDQPRETLLKVLMAATNAAYHEAEFKGKLDLPTRKLLGEAAQKMIDVVACANMTMDGLSKETN
jgi:hypothetical protein